MQWFQPNPWFQRQPLLVKVLFVTFLAAGIGIGGALVGWAAAQVF
jgi:hypothetical protein